MNKSVKKSFCVAYDTFLDLKEDKNIRDKMVVMTLGYETINDNRGGVYRIVSKNDITKDTKGESLGRDSRYFAEVINVFNNTDIVNKLNDNVNNEVADLSVKWETIHRRLQSLDTRFNNLKKQS